MTAHQVQLSNRTRANRYPHVFEPVARMAAALQRPQLRVLSFGCSTGEEPSILATHYLPGAEILGVDIAPDALAEARARCAALAGVTIAESTPETLRSRGPFDLIFAMSVLCRWPTSRRMASIGELFPFARFTEQATLLDEVLAPGGLLVIYNANYSFLQTPVAANYDVVVSPQIDTAGFVKRFLPDGNAAPASETTECVFRKRLPDPEGEEDPALIVLDEQLRQIARLPRLLFVPEGTPPPLDRPADEIRAARRARRIRARRERAAGAL